jgi:hypothetical protein
MRPRDFEVATAGRYRYVGRMRRVSGDTADNAAIAHHLFGTPKNARHPQIVFWSEPWAWFFGMEVLLVWVAVE